MRGSGTLGFICFARLTTFKQGDRFVEVDFLVTVVVVVAQTMTVVRRVNGRVRLRETMKPDLHICNITSSKVNEIIIAFM